jgi:hypothetical protein
VASTPSPRRRGHLCRRGEEEGAGRLRAPGHPTRPRRQRRRCKIRPPGWCGRELGSCAWLRLLLLLPPTNRMSPDATPTSVAPAVGPPLPAGEEAGRLRAPRRLARPRLQGSADASWAVFFMRGAGQLGVGTEVEIVGDVANRMEKLEAAIGDKPDRVPGLTRVWNGLFHT